MTVPTTTKLPFIWAVRRNELGEYYPCDAHLPDADAVLWRAVDVVAPASTVFRWLCQLRVAPYSYDWADNGGRRSPSQLTPGTDLLERGQRVMTIFRLAEFKIPDHLTIVMNSPLGLRIFGALAVSYRVISEQDLRARLVAKLRVRYPRTLWGRCMQTLFPWGDLLMMRKQLLTLKELAEQFDQEA